VQEKPTLIIEAGRTELHYWHDLWRHRGIFYFLASRDILLRYKQTVIEILWTVARSLLAIVVFTVIFGKLAKWPSGESPYSILVCAAVLPWQFFASAFAEAGNRPIGNTNLVSKVYFPRLIVPASAIVVTLVDFPISAVILVGLTLWYGFLPDWRVLA
jgi:lipopolysaccharide transport system permease protein